ncbi:MAG: hypothetical protein BGO57_00570 [Sphingomonadales bacterium 63-6]|nr:MAG: hypothetical protein BGO57_00570 [Sphingomonadales bacterium 63-6]
MCQQRSRQASKHGSSSIAGCGSRLKEPESGILQNARVELVGQDERHVWAMTSDNRRFGGTVMVGTDGYQRLVWRKICLEHSC